MFAHDGLLSLTLAKCHKRLQIQEMMNEILKLEEKIIDAIVSSDVEVLDQLLHDELLFVNHLGMTVSKKNDLAPHISGDLKIATIEISDQHIGLFGDTAVVTVSKKIKGSYFKQEFESLLKFTRVWKLLDQQWKVIAASSTPLQF